MSDTHCVPAQHAPYSPGAADRAGIPRCRNPTAAAATAGPGGGGGGRRRLEQLLGVVCAATHGPIDPPPPPLAAAAAAARAAAAAGAGGGAEPEEWGDVVWQCCRACVVQVGSLFRPSFCLSVGLLVDRSSVGLSVCRSVCLSVSIVSRLPFSLSVSLSPCRNLVRLQSFPRSARLCVPDCPHTISWPFGLSVIHHCPSPRQSLSLRLALSRTRILSRARVDSTLYSLCQSLSWPLSTSRSLSRARQLP